MVARTFPCTFLPWNGVFFPLLANVFLSIVYFFFGSKITISATCPKCDITLVQTDDLCRLWLIFPPSVSVSNIPLATSSTADKLLSQVLQYRCLFHRGILLIKGMRRMVCGNDIHDIITKSPFNACTSSILRRGFILVRICICLIATFWIHRWFYL